MDGDFGAKRAGAEPKCAELLEDLLDELERRRGQPRSIELAHGRCLELSPFDRGVVLQVRRRDGTAEVTIEIGPTGPVVRVDAAALEVACRGDLSIDCESLAVRAKQRIDLACERGDVRIDAGDDVVVTGERIRLN